jgi:hypothetical protein
MNFDEFPREFLSSTVSVRRRRRRRNKQYGSPGSETEMLFDREAFPRLSRQFVRGSRAAVVAMSAAAAATAAAVDATA